MNLAPHHFVAINEYKAACQQFAECPVGDVKQRAAAKKRIGSAERKMRRAFGASIEECERRMYEISKETLLRA